jgi:hypothetical protein
MTTNKIGIEVLLGAKDIPGLARYLEWVERRWTVILRCNGREFSTRFFGCKNCTTPKAHDVFHAVLDNSVRTIADGDFETFMENGHYKLNKGEARCFYAFVTEEAKRFSEFLGCWVGDFYRSGCKRGLDSAAMAKLACQEGPEAVCEGGEYVS